MSSYLRLLKMNLLRSGVYKQIVRHPWICIACLFVCLYAILVLLRSKHLRFFGFDVSLDKRDAANFIDDIAENLDIHIEPPDNFNVDGEGCFTLPVTFTNNGHREIAYGKWVLFLNSLPPVKPETIACGMSVAHVNGGLYYITPVKDGFRGIKAHTSLVCRFHLHHNTVARTDFMPNWYVGTMDDSLEPKVISSTSDDALSFVGKFDSPVQWKNNPMDNFNPFTPETRYEMNTIPENTAARLILPTPKSLRTLPGKRLKFDPKVWRVLRSGDFPNEAQYLSETAPLVLSSTKDKPKSKYVELIQSDDISDAEEYKLVVSVATESVHITAKSSAGAFYGVQTLLSILSMDDDKEIPAVEIKDNPRFSYRGVMIDVARNFQSKEAILKFIDVMSTYKLNKLHLHLSDDEGWRLEIPGLPELVEVGSKRCHPMPHRHCLIPSLGSGPYANSPGSGFYTVAEYREILKYANERHVQVIPEIDMPGHARAAIQSMEQREEAMEGKSNIFKTTSYLLSDDDDEISAQSVQSWIGNAINPCLNSTYQFIEKILDTLITFHKGIQDLKLFHFGGDEVAPGAWDNSPMCKQLFKQTSIVNSELLKKWFVHTVAGIAHKKGLNLAAWEDGMYEFGLGPFTRQEFRNNDMFVIPWANVWERGTGGRAIEFADAGYKVILAMATHLYFDHSYEPDPEERGLHWATRYTDTRKTFGFMPEDIFANADVSLYGIPYNVSQLCNNEVCPKTRNPENVVGLQACLWGETLRSASHLHLMAFPRILALAERAWHKAPWEYIENPDERNRRRQHDWESFAKTLGDKELPRLEKMGVYYRVPIPGAVLQDGVLKVNVQYPNHDIELSTDAGQTWNVLDSDQITIAHKNISIRSKTRLLRRTSRTIQLAINSSPSSFDNANSLYYMFSVYFINTIYFIIK